MARTSAANRWRCSRRWSHQQFTDPKIGELLAAIEASDLVKDPESGRGGELPRASPQL